MTELICPHFGTKSDPETPLAYATPIGRCYRSGKAATVSVRHQGNYCVNGEHPTCPYLLKQQAKDQQADAASTAAAAPKAEKPPVSKRVEPKKAEPQKVEAKKVEPKK